MKIQFIRLFTKINYKGDITPPAIISFGQICIEWRKDLGNGIGRSVVSKYRTDLQINFWLVILTFQWFSHP